MRKHPIRVETVIFRLALMCALFAGWGQAVDNMFQPFDQPSSHTPAFERFVP